MEEELREDKQETRDSRRKQRMQRRYAGTFMTTSKKQRNTSQEICNGETHAPPSAGIAQFVGMVGTGMTTMAGGLIVSCVSRPDARR